MLKLLYGPIASGKSTYSRKEAEQGAIVVNDDAIVNAIHAGLNTQYCKELKPLYKSVENLIVMWALSKGKTVIVDRPNLNPESRKRYIGLAKACDTTVMCVWFPDEGEEVHVARRMNHDPRGCTEQKWQEVYRRHKEQMVEPTREEGIHNFQKATIEEPT